jgi:hypothetical protein
MCPSGSRQSSTGDLAVPSRAASGRENLKSPRPDLANECHNMFRSHISNVRFLKSTRIRDPGMLLLSIPEDDYESAVC